MILNGLLFGFLASFAVVSCKDAEPIVPLVLASDTSSDVEGVSNLLPKNDEVDDLALVPETRGRSDIDIEEETPQEPPRGYFYPKPSKPFDLPVFQTLQPDGSSFLNPGFEEGEDVERLPRSPQRPQTFYPFPGSQTFYPPSTNFPNRFPPSNSFPNRFPPSNSFPNRFPPSNSFPNRFPPSTNFPNRFPPGRYPIRPLPATYQ